MGKSRKKKKLVFGCVARCMGDPGKLRVSTPVLLYKV